MHTKPTVLVLQFRRQGYTGTGTWKTPKTDFPTTKRNISCVSVQPRTSTNSSCQYRGSTLQLLTAGGTQLTWSPRRSAERQKIHAKFTVLVSWYPRVQFKVRVFRAPVVTGTVPVVLYILVRSWKDVISMVLRRRNTPTSKLMPRNGVTYSITCARFPILSPLLSMIRLTQTLPRGTRVSTN